MATLVFTAVGTALGGPLGGLVGGLVGRQVDAAIFGEASHKGPRLDDLRVTTSSYGSAIPRHHGQIRAPGTIIWSTDLIEHTDSEGGGKSSPSVTTYRYSVSLAVALASRPIQGVARIWADGSLLRGAAGDLKICGTLRIYSGHGDDPVDPLLASAEGIYAPAHRGTAYAVFEDLDLATFGNRIPALSFEIIADESATTLASMLPDIIDPAAVTVALPGLSGFSCDGGPMVQTLATLDAVYPIACDAGGNGLTIFPAEDIPADPPTLPEPTTTRDSDSFGNADGKHRRRAPTASDIPSVLRYYDIERDYLAGLQRADGRARPGRERTIEFPGALAASDARSLANSAAERAGWSREMMLWRVAELDPALSPGRIVRAPGMAGLWRITSWEWLSEGIELQLLRLPYGPGRQQPGDAGQANLPTDLQAGPTQLEIFELPQATATSVDIPALYAAPSSNSAGWAGAALYVDNAGELVPLGSIGRQRSIIGTIDADLAPSPSMLLERQAVMTVTLAATDLALTNAGAAALAAGANRAMIGNEILQYACATALGGGKWRLEGLLRGRGGTEAMAQSGHLAGAGFVLLDDTLRPLDTQIVGDSAVATIVAIGLGDSAPVTVTVTNPGLTLRPPCPVHPRAITQADGSLVLCWIRRARGAWGWRDGVDVPLVEQTESYLVGLGPVSAPDLQWEVSSPTLLLDPATVASLASTHSGAAIWVRQIGNHALSYPLLLTTLL